MRISGPLVSSMIATGDRVRWAATRMFFRVSACVCEGNHGSQHATRHSGYHKPHSSAKTQNVCRTSWLPWEKLSRATFMPLSIMVTSVSTSLQAGPIVHTTYTQAGRAATSLGPTQIGAHSSHPHRTLVLRPVPSRWVRTSWRLDGTEYTGHCVSTQWSHERIEMRREVCSPDFATGYRHTGRTCASAGAGASLALRNVSSLGLRCHGMR